MIPAIVLFLSDFMNNKVSKKTDIEKFTSLTTIGVIARNNLKTDFPVLKYPNSSITESFRSLRTNLQYLLEKDQSNVIAIQSMISGEGKSFVALNLALAFAINNKKVLVVDGDLRKPQLHVKFSDTNDKGLTNYLMNKATFEDVAKESKTKNLFYTTTGPVLRNTAELLDSERLKSFVAEAKKNFNFVFFNNSPISIVTDGILIGSISDSNLIVLRQNFSFIEHLKLVNEFARQGVIKNISIIFNDVKTDGYGYYANRNNGYGYFKDPDKKSERKWKFKTSKETLDHV
jgi:tyrosine-protein kinase Etk/Wzc